MTHCKAILLSSLLVAASICSVSANEKKDIVDNIEADSTCSVSQPEQLRLRLQKQTQSLDPDTITEQGHVSGKHIAGYRIQVFSDNNTRTAKAEARSMARNISERFPEYRTYVIYNSPFWRLRVGDFLSEEDANDAAVEIKSAFPAYRREVRVVRDKINYIE